MASDSYHIQYKTDDGSNWTACLGGISTVIIKGARVSTSDPEFVHLPANGGPSHTDERIRYITLDGSVWWAKIHATSNFPSNSADYYFEHWKEIGGDKHADTKIIYQTWDGSFEVATVKEIDQGNGNFTVVFNVSPQR